MLVQQLHRKGRHGHRITRGLFHVILFIIGTGTIGGRPPMGTIPQGLAAGFWVRSSQFGLRWSPRVYLGKLSLPRRGHSGAARKGAWGPHGRFGAK